MLEDPSGGIAYVLLHILHIVAGKEGYNFGKNLQRHVARCSHCSSYNGVEVC